MESKQGQNKNEPESFLSKNTENIVYATVGAIKFLKKSLDYMHASLDYVIRVVTGKSNEWPILKSELYFSNFTEQ